MENEKKQNNINLRALRGGSYSLVLCAVALAFVIILNLFVSALPSTVTKVDASTLGLLNISDETRKIIDSVDEPITMYLIAQYGSEDVTTYELLQRYAALNSHITVETVDPDTHPGFTSQYTTDTLSANSVIVESEKRFYIIDYYDIYTTSYENLTEEDLYNYYLYGITPTGTHYYEGECEFTSALDYVTADSIPTVYALSGHDEDSLSDTMLSYFSTENILNASLNLLSDEGIPEDCSAVMICNPKSDISAYESSALISYLDQGGNIILVTDFRYCTQENMPNLNAVTAHMGMRSDDGIVVEGNSGNYNRYPSYLLPVISSSAVTDQLESTDFHILLPNAHGIAMTGDSDANVSPLLKTTTASFLKKAGVNLQTYEKEDGDTDGPCVIAASASLTTENGTAKMVWYSSPYIVSDEMDYYVNGGNSELFVASVTWMCEKVVSVSVLAKVLQVEALVLSDASANTWTAIITILLPLTILAGGFFIWFRRTRK